MSTIQEFDYSVDVLSSLLWQFNEAINLETLLRSKQAFYNRAQRDFWSNWYRDVFDLRTANEFGLSVWSNILDVPFFSGVEQSPANYPAFGFDTGRSDSPIQNFNNGNFASRADDFTNLDTEQKRLLLRLRYFQLVTTCTVPEINQFINTLFPQGLVYVLDGNNMTMTYVFTFIPPSNLLRVAQDFDILPRPSGVELNIVITPFVGFGFGEFRRNFNNGNFFTGAN